MCEQTQNIISQYEAQGGKGKAGSAGGRGGVTDSINTNRTNEAFSYTFIFIKHRENGPTVITSPQRSLIDALRSLFNPTTIQKVASLSGSLGVNSVTFM